MIDLGAEESPGGPSPGIKHLRCGSNKERLEKPPKLDEARRSPNRSGVAESAIDPEIGYIAMPHLTVRVASHLPDRLCSFFIQDDSRAGGLHIRSGVHPYCW